jgi:hypothetical protein
MDRGQNDKSGNIKVPKVSLCSASGTVDPYKGHTLSNHHYYY